MIIGVTGARGNLGKELMRYSECNSLDFDIRNRVLVHSNLAGKRDFIIHCAAYTDVDGCEENVNNALSVNWFGTRNIVMFAMCPVIYISTDFVYDGKRGPYGESVYAPSPISMYGFSKYAGERTLREVDTVVRTTVLYGGHKPDFVTWVLDNLRNKKHFGVSHALKCSPTYIPHLAEALIQVCKMNDEDRPRMINIVGDTVLSRYEFALMIATVFECDKKLILPTQTVKLGAAKRPRKAGLRINFAEQLGLPIYSPQEGLKDLKERLENE